MGNQQPKKLKPVTKIQIDVATTKSKFHLELMRDRKNAQIIKAEKQLVARIKSHSRNKVEQILIAERIINALKYAQACNYLMSYCASLKAQANFLAQNLFNPTKLQPYLGMIYSLIYAAETLGLSSLKEFRDLMRALNDPTALPTFTNPEIRDLLTPQPTPAELNMYFLEMSERNQIPLEEINIIGHKFSKNFNEKPSNQPTFSQIEKKLAQQLKKNMGNQANQGGNNQGQGGYGGFGGNYGGFGGNQAGYGGNQGGFSNNNVGFGGNDIPPNYGNNNYMPPGMSKPAQSSVHDSNPYGIKETQRPTNFGPEFYTPKNVQPSKQLPKPYIPTTQSHMSIKDINDIAYFPEISPSQQGFNIDPDFNTLCERIRVGL